MSQQAVQELVEKWTTDPAFHAQMQQDPEAAIRNSGLNLSPDEMAEVKNIASENLTGQDLHARVSKFAAMW